MPMEEGLKILVFSGLFPYAILKIQLYKSHRKLSVLDQQSN